MSTDAAPDIHEAHQSLDKIFAIMKTYPQGNGLSTHEYRPSDIIIATFPKSGTTLLQNLCYSLACLTGGGPEDDPLGENFSDIELVAPWIEYAPQIGIEVGASNPRVYKTHQQVDKLRVGRSKYVVVVRDPRKIIGSWLDFLYDWILGEEAKGGVMVRREVFQELARRRLLGTDWAGEKVDPRYGTWFEWVKGWMDEMSDEVLVLFYEDVVADLAGTVREVGRFMGTKVEDQVVREVVKRCGREEMAGKDKFSCVAWAKAMGIRKGGMKAVSARKDGFQQFDLEEEIKEGLKVKMRETFGVDTYGDMRAMVKTKQRIIRERTD